MSNSKSSALPTASSASQDAKPKKSSYWLTEEEIAELHEDLVKGIRDYAAKHGYKVVEDKYGSRLVKES